MHFPNLNLFFQPAPPPCLIQVRYFAKGDPPDNFPTEFQKTKEGKYVIEKCNLPTDMIGKNDVLVNFNKTELRGMDYIRFSEEIRGKIKNGQKCTMQILKAGYPKGKLVRGAEVMNCTTPPPQGIHGNLGL